MDFDYSLQHPFVLVCSGASQSGKSTLINELILRKDQVISKKIERIIYCYCEDEPSFASHVKEQYKGEGIQVEFQKGIDVDVVEGNTIPTLVVLDDFMEEIGSSKQVCNMVTRGSHHRSMSLIITIQNFFYKNCRTLTLNSKYIALFRNPRDTSICNYLGRQMNSGKSYPLLEAAYKDATKNKPNSYLFIDMSQQQNDDYRIRSSIFPDSNCIVYISKK